MAQSLCYTFLYMMLFCGIIVNLSFSLQVSKSDPPTAPSASAISRGRSEISTQKFKSLLSSKIVESPSIITMKKNLYLSVFSSSRGLVDGLTSLVPLKTRDSIIQLPKLAALYGASKSNELNPYSIIEPTALQLLREWKKGDLSLHSSYINLLPIPGAVGTLIHWSDDDLMRLSYEPLIKSVKSQREQWSSMHKKMVRDEPDLVDVVYERYVWALEVVASRAFTGLSIDATGSSGNTAPSIALMLSAVLTMQMTSNDVIAGALATAGAIVALFPLIRKPSRSTTVLLPIVDCCNHKGSSPTAELYLEPSSSSFVVRATGDIATDDEITISYGDRHNDDLLQYFGFVEKENAHDRCVIMRPLETLDTLLCSSPSIEGDVEEIVTKIGSIRSAVGFKDSALVVSGRAMQAWSLGSLPALRDEVAASTWTSLLRILIDAEQARLRQALEKTEEERKNHGYDSDERSGLIVCFVKEKIEVCIKAAAQRL